MPSGSRSQSGTLIGVGLELYGLPRTRLPKLFGKKLKASRPCGFGGKRGLRGLERASIGRLRSPDTGLFLNFQTVSPGTWVNSPSQVHRASMRGIMITSWGKGPSAARYRKEHLICPYPTPLDG
jgi:hypothetical protein